MLLRQTWVQARLPVEQADTVPRVSLHPDPSSSQIGKIVVSGQIHVLRLHLVAVWPLQMSFLEKVHVVLLVIVLDPPTSRHIMHKYRFLALS